MTDSMSVDFEETGANTAATIANILSDASGFITDFWDSIDVRYTPSAISLKATFKVYAQNAGTTEIMMPMSFEWYEDAAVQKTRMVNAFNAFTAGIAALAAVVSYTNILHMICNMTLKVTYS